MRARSHPIRSIRRCTRPLQRFPHAPEAVVEALVAELAPLCRQRGVELLSLITASPELVLDPEGLRAALRAIALTCLDAPDSGGALLVAVVASERDVTLTLASDRPSFSWALGRAQRGLGAIPRVRTALCGLRTAVEAHRGSLELTLCKPTARLDLHLPIDPEAPLRAPDGVTRRCTFARDGVLSPSLESRAQG